MPEDLDGNINCKVPGTLVYKHTRHMPENVERAYQALAIDEFRPMWAERVWIVPKGNELKLRKGDKAVYVPAFAEQRWFAGAHSNVGGGYAGDQLRLIPLRWMQDKASSAGLKFQELAEPPCALSVDSIRDSYEEFLKEHPRTRKILEWRYPKYTRKILAKRFGTEDASSDFALYRRLNETLDVSVANLICAGGYKRPHIRDALECIAAGNRSDSQLAREALRAMKSS